jgi:REP element-mobilizing transposase RayT
MVIAYHLIWTAYGTWFPNDPRGSGSRSVYTPVLAELGELHFGRKRSQPARSKVREFYAEAEPRLDFPVIRFDGHQRDEIAAAFAETIHEKRYTCYACAIMPDHVHVVIRKHRHRGEDMIDRFQETSRSRLASEGIFPPAHPVWTKNGWKVFLASPSEVRQRIRYVENNPAKEGLPRQHWPFVVPYDDWPFHKKLIRKRAANQ